MREPGADQQFEIRQLRLLQKMVEKGKSGSSSARSTCTSPDLLFRSPPAPRPPHLLLPLLPHRPSRSRAQIPRRLQISIRIRLLPGQGGRYVFGVEEGLGEGWQGEGDGTGGVDDYGVDSGCESGMSPAGSVMLGRDS